MKRSQLSIQLAVLALLVVGAPSTQAVEWTETTVLSSSTYVFASPRIAEDDDGYPNILYTIADDEDPEPIYWIRKEAGGWTSSRIISYDSEGDRIFGFTSFEFDFNGNGNLAAVASRWTGGYGEEREILFLWDVEWSDFSSSPYPAMIQASGRWQHAIDPALVLFPGSILTTPPKIGTVFSGHLHGDHTNHDLFWILSSGNDIQNCSQPYDVSRYVSYSYGSNTPTPTSTPTGTPTPAFSPTSAPSPTKTLVPTVTPSPQTPFPTPMNTPTCPPSWTPMQSPTLSPTPEGSTTATPTPRPMNRTNPTGDHNNKTGKPDQLFCAFTIEDPDGDDDGIWVYSYETRDVGTSTWFDEEGMDGDRNLMYQEWAPYGSEQFYPLGDSDCRLPFLRLDDLPENEDDRVNIVYIDSVSLPTADIILHDWFDASAWNGTLTIEGSDVRDIRPSMDFDPQNDAVIVFVKETGGCDDQPYYRKVQWVGEGDESTYELDGESSTAVTSSTYKAIQWVDVAVQRGISGVAHVVWSAKEDSEDDYEIYWKRITY